MILQLDQEVLNKHQQKFRNSCVAMGVEFVLKLMHSISADSFDLQNKYGDQQKSGADFHGKTINGVRMQMEFNILRGPDFPLNELFDKIKFELDNGRYVNCAWRQSSNSFYHAYVIYGYKEDEFLAISTDFNSSIEYIKDMKSRLKEIQGSDIITFNRT